jgi:hypothetical protein
MPNPESGGGAQGAVGKWQTVNLAIPDFLAEIRQAINAFFSAIIQLLNVLLAILEVLKTLMFGFLDPIIALIEALLTAIENFLRDLRNAGLYIHGDFYILEGPEFKDLLGGYNAYETRMITRLVDRRDPNRPDISSRSACLAVFLYVSVDLTSFHRLLRLLRGILALFNRKVPNLPAVGQVTAVNAQFGLEGASIFSFKKSFFPDFRFKNPDDDPFEPAAINTVNLTWRMAPAPGNFLTLFAQLPPRGFLVEISTIYQPLKLAYEKPPKGADQAATVDPSLPAPKREAGFIVDEDGVPIQLTGGADWINPTTRSTFRFNSPVGFAPTLNPKIYGIKTLADAVPVPLEDLRAGNKYFLQKTFFVPTTQSLFFPGKGYGVSLQFEDMPFAAEWEFDNGKAKRIADDEQPLRYFVRVRAVTKNIEDVGVYQYELSQADFELPAPIKARLPDGIDFNNVGAPSAPFELVWPSSVTVSYLNCLANALALMVLSRSDLAVKTNVGDPPADGSAAPETTANFPPDDYAPWSAFEGSARLRTGLEDAAKILMPRLLGRSRAVSKYYQGAQGDDIAKWRLNLHKRCVNLANFMYRQNRPTATIEKLVVDSCQDLLNFDFADIKDYGDPGSQRSPLDLGGNILTSLLDTRERAGISPNLGSTGLPDPLVAQTRASDLAFLLREPHFFQFDGQGNEPPAADPEPALDNDPLSDFARREGRIDLDQINEDLFTAGDDEVVGVSELTVAADGRVVIFGSGSRDEDVPVIYQRNHRTILRMDFLRNVVPDNVYAEAATALRLGMGPLARPQEKGWIAIRLFPQGIPDIDRFLDELLALLKSIKAALQSIADLIRRFIEFLQARIIELQALLNRINAVIQNLLRLFGGLPAVAGLITIADGTDGVLASLVSAQNKPFDSPAAYGGGVVLLAGGIPTIALDIFKALVQGDG